MTKRELLGLLSFCGEDLAKNMLKFDNESLNCINRAMHNKLVEYVSKDPQGLTQLGSMLGHPRAVNVVSSLRNVGFDAYLFNKKESLIEKRCDISLEGVPSECRGSITHHSNKKYGTPRGGKFSLDHSKRIYYIVKEKIDLGTVALTSLLFQVLYIDSSKFEKNKSSKVNITQLKKICPEDIIGEWEVWVKSG